VDNSKKRFNSNSNLFDILVLLHKHETERRQYLWSFRIGHENDRKINSIDLNIQTLGVMYNIYTYVICMHICYVFPETSRRFYNRRVFKL